MAKTKPTTKLLEAMVGAGLASLIVANRGVTVAYDGCYATGTASGFDAQMGLAARLLGELLATHADSFVETVWQERDRFTAAGRPVTTWSEFVSRVESLLHELVTVDLCQDGIEGLKLVAVTAVTRFEKALGRPMPLQASYCGMCNEPVPVESDCTECGSTAGVVEQISFSWAAPDLRQWLEGPPVFVGVGDHVAWMQNGDLVYGQVAQLQPTVCVVRFCPSGAISPGSEFPVEVRDMTSYQRRVSALVVHP